MIFKKTSNIASFSILSVPILLEVEAPYKQLFIAKSSLLDQENKHEIYFVIPPYIGMSDLVTMLLLAIKCV